MKMSNKMYDTLKQITQVALPAVGVFYATVANIWGLPFGEEIAATVAAAVTMLGAFLGVSSAVYKKHEGKDE